MGWCFYELARSPHCQQRLYEEIMGISAKHNNKFTYDALEEMIYLDGVVHGERHRITCTTHYQY